MTRTEVMLQAAIVQRNNALDTIIYLQGEIAELSKRIEELTPPEPTNASNEG